MLRWSGRAYAFIHTHRHTWFSQEQVQREQSADGPWSKNQGLEEGWLHASSNCKAFVQASWLGYMSLRLGLSVGVVELLIQVTVVAQVCSPCSDHCNSQPLTTRWLPETLTLAQHASPDKVGWRNLSQTRSIVPENEQNVT